MSLITDFQPLQQPENSYPFALNAIKSTATNFRSVLASEPGNILITMLKPNYSVIGKIYYDNKNLIFSTNNIDSEIGIYNNDNYTVVFSDENKADKLNFRKEEFILGQHRILKGCEDVFYFSDGINPDRYLNLLEVPQNASDMNILKEIKQPIINQTILNSGGSIKAGSVSFALQYVDVNGNIFYTSKVTQALPIYADSISPSANGNFNINTTTTTLGGVPKTSKAVEINITNTDLKFPFAQIIVIYDNTLAYKVDTLIPVSDSITFTYRGENDLEIPIAEVLVGNANYISSLANEQIQGRFVRANVKELTKNYSGLQQLVMNVTVRPKVISVLKTEYINDPNNYTNLTFQSDEVYALGLVGTYDDGTETPPFHIPGRSAFPGELNEIEFKGSTFPWFVLNNKGTETQMGYYESDNIYPEIYDCNNEHIYNNEFGKIRHHKIPSRKAIPLENGDNVNLIGLELDNIPQVEGISSWRLVYSREQPTVIDSGFLLQSNINPSNNRFELYGDIVFQGALGYINRNISNFISPKSLIQDSIRGDYFNLITNITTIEEDADVIENEGDFESVEVFTHRIVNFNYLGQTIQDINLPYENMILLNPGEINRSIFGVGVSNESYSNTVVATDVDYSAAQTQIGVTNAYVVNKNLTRPYNNLFNIVYADAVKKDNVYVGDTFITTFDYFNIYQSNVRRGGFVGLGRNDYNIKAIYNTGYVESTVNMALLVQGEEANTHYDFSGANYALSKASQVVDNKITFKPIDLEYYAENINYRYSRLNKYVPLPQSYDYCNTCIFKNPHRVIFSPKGFQQELQDVYLINRINDYIDIPANTGPITGLKYKNDRLYVHTTQTSYVLTPNPQFITTNQNVAQLSEGDFLSIPAQQIMHTDYGYGGMQSKISNINTEFGYFWVDGVRGAIHHIHEGIKDITKTGNISFFKNNLNKDSVIHITYDPYFLRLLFTVHNKEGCRKKHTLSYSLSEDSFTSFHSYLPDFYFNNQTHYYSILNNEIYRHERNRRYSTYYGKKDNFVIEQVNPVFQTSNLISVLYYAEFFENEQEVKDHFNKLIVYNSNQSSGEHNLFLAGTYDNLNVNPRNKSIKETDKNYFIGNLWDNSISNDVYIPDCSSEEYSDKLFINTAQNNNFYNKPLFKEKYTISRLKYRPTNDRSVLYYLQIQNKQPSIR